MPEIEYVNKNLITGKCVSEDQWIRNRNICMEYKQSKNRRKKNKVVIVKTSKVDSIENSVIENNLCIRKKIEHE